MLGRLMRIRWVSVGFCDYVCVYLYVNTYSYRYTHTHTREHTHTHSQESMLVKMLTVVKDRVVAEIRTRDKPHVRMLAALLRIEDAAELQGFLRGSVQNPEAAAKFEEFVLDGIQYMEQHRADWLVDERVEKMKDIAHEVARFRDILEERRRAERVSAQK
jgi:hypothetical protein